MLHNGFEEHHFTKVQQAAYDAIMQGQPTKFLQCRGSGKTYLYKCVKEDLERIERALDMTLPGESEPDRYLPWFMMPKHMRALPLDQRAEALIEYEKDYGPYDWKAMFLAEGRKKKD